MIARAQHDRGSAGQEQAVGVGVQLVLLAGLGMGVGLGPAGWLAGIGCTGALWAILTAALRRSRTRSLGQANRVTLARAVLVGNVAALVADHDSGGLATMALVILSSVALVLDAVDGRVARRTGSVSPLGARFDMEVDAFLILVLSVQVATSLGVWVLAIGALRYAFVAAAWVLPWLGSALPPSFARKTVAAVQGVILVAAASGLVPQLLAIVLVGLALALLVWSFGRDVLWLQRVSGASPSRGR
jgi:phosphatidylglycerophosphate synthase